MMKLLKGLIKGLFRLCAYIAAALGAYTLFKKYNADPKADEEDEDEVDLKDFELDEDK